MAALLLLCSGPLTAQTPDSAQENPRQVADAIIKEAGQHLGKPYKYGGNGPESFDCTGFTCYVFKQFGYKLSRTSSDQAKNGREVKGGIEKYQKGDLVIFGGRSTKKTPGHVGIFIAADSPSPSSTPPARASPSPISTSRTTRSASSACAASCPTSRRKKR